LLNNTDPNQTKQAEKRKAADEAMVQKFEGVALDMVRVKSAKWSLSYTGDVVRRFEAYVSPYQRSILAW